MVTSTEGPAAQAIRPAGAGELGERLMVGILGRARQGKGLLSGYLAYAAHLAGVRVFHIGNLGFGEVLDIQKLASTNPADLSNCLVVIDEIKQVLPSHGQASAFQQMVNSNLIQSGHFGLSVLWTTITDRGLDPTLYEMTDFTYTVEGAHQRWTTDKDIQEGRVDPDDDNRCPAWDKSSPYHKDHAEPGGLLTSCLDVPEKRAVRYRVVSQRGSGPGYGRWRKQGTLHCAHRMYGITNTTYTVDASARMHLTSDEIRAAGKQKNFQVVRQVLAQLGDMGYEKLGLGDIADAMVQATNGEVAINNDELSKHLRDAGVAKKRGGGGMRYEIAAWRDSHPA